MRCAAGLRLLAKRCAGSADGRSVERCVRIGAVRCVALGGKRRVGRCVERRRRRCRENRNGVFTRRLRLSGVSLDAAVGVFAELSAYRGHAILRSAEKGRFVRFVVKRPAFLLLGAGHPSVHGGSGPSGVAGRQAEAAHIEGDAGRVGQGALEDVGGGLAFAKSPNVHQQPRRYEQESAHHQSDDNAHVCSCVPMHSRNGRDVPCIFSVCRSFCWCGSFILPPIAEVARTRFCSAHPKRIKIRV